MVDPTPSPAKPGPEDPHTPYRSRASSVPDDSDTEFVPTPIHSPGGPQYDDLPPSYDEATGQAAADARNGVIPLDPNQLEAHRLTLNEDPYEPEVWEYRLRGEQLDDANEHELAPEYGRTVPIEHIQTSDSIPIGRTGRPATATATATADPGTTLLTAALRFTRHEPDADAQYAPRLTRPIAIPQQGLARRRSTGERHHRGRRRRSRDEQSPQHHTASSGEALHLSSDHPVESVQFLRAYAKALHPHSIRPAEFSEFLDGLNVLCEATNMTADELLHQGRTLDGPSSIVHDYVNGANESFFAPRGLRVSLQPLSALLGNLNIPNERGQRSDVLTSVLDPSTATERRAQALYPWIETLETNVPSQSSQALALQEMTVRLLANHRNTGSTSDLFNRSSLESSRGVRHEAEHDDPPHSIPDEHGRDCGSRGRGSHGRRGRDGRRGGPWGPFGPRGYGPFGPPGYSPFGPQGHGPFGPTGFGPFGPHGFHGHHGHGPFGRHGNGPFGPHGSGPGDSFHHSRGRGFRSHGPNSHGNPNEWAAWGEQIGRWGEDFGKRMGDWGQQFGKRAETWGQDVGKAAEAWGQDVSTRASGSGTQSRDGQGISDTHIHDHPQSSYPEGSGSQQTGVIREHDNARNKTNEKDDDASSISSGSSDSDSDFDSDSDDEDYPDTEAAYIKRLSSINEYADAQLKKGKKSPGEVEKERAVAIEKAHYEKQASDVKIEQKQSKREKKRAFKQQFRELKKQYRQKKREVKEGYKGKGKGKGKKSKEWKATKIEYKAKKSNLKKEKYKARSEWHEARNDRRRANRDRVFGERRCGSGSSDEVPVSDMVMVVVENLNP